MGQIAVYSTTIAPRYSGSYSTTIAEVLHPRRTPANGPRTDGPESMQACVHNGNGSTAVVRSDVRGITGVALAITCKDARLNAAPAHLPATGQGGLLR